MRRFIGMSLVHKLLITCRSGKAFTPIRQAFTSTANPAESTQLFSSCHHSVIFPVETNVTEMGVYLKYK